ncbi:hypothetical protein [Paenarthrobacter nitroguajacolicus]|uniref:hypothetical protein n=1 Tax=Paenarthrobacter nitroguajacolicus TaxID=211146 RepID=UPI000AEC5F6D|nr:hypothetical protein [Paenarthrobacter nitroguajacolicus]
MNAPLTPSNDNESTQPMAELDICNSMIPASKQPCIECPFREANGDIPAPQGWYDKENFERVWASVARENKYFPCHMFDSPDNTGYDSRSEDMGLRKPVDLGKPKECAGITAMIHKEVELAAEYPDWESYISARPAGLQRDAYDKALRRIAGEGLPMTKPANPDKAKVFDPAARVTTDSFAWKLGDAGVQAMLDVVQGVMDDIGVSLPTCNCNLCQNHETVHPAEVLTTATGDKVKVDAALHPLLTALSTAGVRTTGSCQAFYEAMQALVPENIRSLASDTTNGVTYSVPLRRREAFIRFENRNPAERKLVKALRNRDWLHLSDGRVEGQISFPLARVPELLTVAQSL